MHAIPMPCRPLAANDNRFWSPADEFNQQEQRRLRHTRIVHEWTEKFHARLEQDVKALCNLLIEGNDDVPTAHSDLAHVVTHPLPLTPIREDACDTEGAPASSQLAEACSSEVSPRVSEAGDMKASRKPSSIAGARMYRSEYCMSGTLSSPREQAQNFEMLPLWGSRSLASYETDAARVEAVELEDEELTIVKAYSGKNKFVQPFIAYPNSPKRLLWDFVGAVLIMYDLFTISLQVFGPPETDLDTAMQWCSLIFWTLNMVASLFVGYVDKGVTIVIFEEIVWNYFKTWFAVDLCVVGVDWVFTILHLVRGGQSGMGGNSVKLFRILRLFRTVRLVRLLKLRKFADALGDLIENEQIGIVISIAR
eukprot:CAMPEP_0117618462 /NCGR_PEP_ID=MMETSP0784-20121206/86117_1 /TAXON_ID=39447 /ORGANISM="" /LENGTH=364 /DNA_ID=CAMNT_0005422329 /DNA_START=38 /DNA_END=1129 /DNA_ORIENTATION=+